MTLFHFDVKMNIANNNNNNNNNDAGDDENGRNNDNESDGEDQNGIVTEDEDSSMELELNRNLDEMKEKLGNEWIGSIASTEQIEYYAKKLNEVGFDSVQLIEECMDFEDYEGRYTNVINFMNPVHKQVFIQNVKDIRKEREDNNNG